MHKLLFIFLAALIVTTPALSETPFLPEKVMRREKELTLVAKGESIAPPFRSGLYVDTPQSVESSSVRQIVLHFTGDTDRQVIKNYFETNLSQRGAPAAQISEFLEHLSSIKAGQQIIVTAYENQIDVMVNAGPKKVVSGKDFQTALVSFLAERTKAADLP